MKDWQLWSKEGGPEEEKKGYQGASQENNRSQNHIDTKGTGLSSHAPGSRSRGSPLSPGKEAGFVQPASALDLS